MQNVVVHFLAEINKPSLGTKEFLAYVCPKDLYFVSIHNAFAMSQTHHLGEVPPFCIYFSPTFLEVGFFFFFLEIELQYETFNTFFNLPSPGGSYLIWGVIWV